MTVEAGFPAADRRGPTLTGWRRVAALGAGNALEWFDWGVYSAMLPFFATYVFGGAGADSLLAGLAVFAAGYIARPLGGLVFGMIADRRGRTIALALTIACVAGGCLGVAFLPGHEQVGHLAGVLLLALRVVQGFGQGGELPSLQVYIAENAPPRHLGRWSSLIYTSGNAGVIGGMTLGAAMATLLPPDDLRSWGWRVPFLLGGLLGLAAVGLRAYLREPAAAEPARPLPLRDHLRALVAHRRALLAISALVAGSTVAIYAWGNSASAFAITFGGMSRSEALWAAVAAYATGAVLIPLWGEVADRVGHRRVMLAGAIVVAVGSLPVSRALSGGPVNLYLCMAAMLIPIGAILSVEPVYIARLVPPGSRTTAIGVTYSIVAAVLGGTAPYLRAWFHVHLGDDAFAVYVTALAVLSVIALVLVRPPEEPSRRDAAS
ncbi:MFS transporter [Tsukamurella sp. 1534]|uniref:MFS transporter n=1 Tax=Tsukamurella sp. 1534 TaxID=1151061 RepID=UPI0003041DDF|nr:MFS transporter [Tsukamurella sp. 1534]